MQAQAAALGLPLVMRRRRSWSDYEAVFIDQLRQFAAAGLTHGLFGDIDLQPPSRLGRARAAPAPGCAPNCRCGASRGARWWTRCSRWATARGWCASMRAGLDAGFCGREFDAGFVADLPAGVDACGENGEFHTFVFDGPRFARPVAHELVAVHERRSRVPADGHHFVAELR